MNEATVQCELFRKLRNLGYKVIAEYNIMNTRADLAIFQDGKCVLLIEVKNRQSMYINKRGRQFNKYLRIKEQLGIKFTYCLNYDDIRATVNYVKRNFPVNYDI